jgi:hypothetical protein
LSAESGMQIDDWHAMDAGRDLVDLLERQRRKMRPARSPPRAPEKPALQ